MRLGRRRFRALRAPAASALRHPGMLFDFLRNRGSASPESPANHALLRRLWRGGVQVAERFPWIHLTQPTSDARLTRQK